MKVIRNSKLLIIIIFFVIFFLIYTNKQINCFVESNLPTDYTNSSSITWLRFIHPKYDFSFNYPSCWDIGLECIPGPAGPISCMANKINGEMYFIFFTQTPLNIKLSQAKNIFLENGTSITYEEDNGFRLYSLPRDSKNNVYIAYQYHSDENKGQEEKIVQSIGDRLLRSVRIEEDSVMRYFGWICPKCFLR